MEHTTKKKLPDEALSNMAAKFPHLDFSRFEYINQLTPSVLSCPVHGERHRSYKDVMRSKNGCDLCGGTGPKAKKTTGQALAVLEQMYGSDTFAYYDFSESIYTGASDPLVFTCPDHGEISTAFNELTTRKSKTPCKWCNIEGRAAAQYDTFESFAEKAAQVHGGKDSLAKVDYRGSKHPVTLTCLLDDAHGEYVKRPNNYLQGQRCPKCSMGQLSDGELELLEFCCTLNTPFVVHQVIFRNRTRPDILLPACNLVIEYHGLYGHSEGMRGRDDCLKRLEYCNAIGLDLIQVFEDEWVYSKEIVKRRISNRVQRLGTVHGRSTLVRRLSAHASKAFLDEYHLQGGTHNPSYAYGLFFGEDLVSVATFSRPRFHIQQEDPSAFEVIRFASKISVTGGFSKLLKAFIAEASPSHIISYADRRWGNGNVYGNAGFTLTGYTEPGYSWSKGQRRYNRMGFQKHKLAELEEFKEVYSADKTADAMCAELGYVKVYDCGHARWELSLT